MNQRFWLIKYVDEVDVIDDIDDVDQGRVLLLQRVQGFNQYISKVKLNNCIRQICFLYDKVVKLLSNTKINMTHN